MEKKKIRSSGGGGGGAHISGAPLDLALNRLLNSLYFWTWPAPHIQGATLRGWKNSLIVQLKSRPVQENRKKYNCCK